MRAATLLTATVIAIALAACAAQPTKPESGASVTPGQANADGAAAADSAPPDSAEAESKRVALAQKMHLKMVNQDGEEVFCKSSTVTGSHIRTEMRCYTAAEMDHMEERAQRDFDQLNKLQTHAVNPGLPSQ